MSDTPLTLGDLEEFSDSLWERIDNDDEDAKLELGKLFTACGLHDFALTHYWELLDSEGANKITAASEIACTLAWVRKFGACSEIIAENPGISDKAQTALLAGEESNWLRKPLGDFLNAFNWVRDNLSVSMEKFFSEPTRGHLGEALNILDLQWVLASDIEQNPGSLHALQSVDMRIAGGLQILKPVADVLPSPTEAAWQLLDFCAAAISRLAEFEPDERLMELATTGFAATNKWLILDSGQTTIQGVPALAINNVSWAMSQTLTDPFSMFAASSLNGMTEI